jgi:tetratricopeptide (TPR) repeat protein
MTEELIKCLGKVSALRVISRTSVMQFKRTRKALPQIGRELNVDAVVEGSVLRSGNRVRVTAQLIQTEPETHLWANSYENELQDVLVLQDEVARAIASEIQIKLTPEDRTRLTAARPINPEAYEAFVKGRHFWDIFTPEAQLKCVQYYEQAIEKDPNYALAYAHVAHCYDMLAFMEQPPAREYQQKARAAAQRALDLDGRLPEALMIFADQKYWLDWDWAAGEAAFRRAMELNPASAEVVFHYGYALEVQGRFGEAIPAYRRAVQLDPLSPNTNGFLAHALLNAHQEEHAIEQYGKMLDFNPRDSRAYAGLGSVYEAVGRNDEAISAYLKAASLDGESAERVEVFRNAYKAGGLKGYWKKRLDYLKEQSKRERVSPRTFALYYAHAGEKEQALEWLEKAYHQHTPRLVWLRAERTWDPLRGDPRYQAILRRMNFPP